MKKYNVFELSVIKQEECDNTYLFICRKGFYNNEYIEIFTKQKFKVTNKELIEPLSNYFSVLELYNPILREPLMLTIKQLLDEYNKINFRNYAVKYKMKNKK